jgi:hypothetical protein
LRVLFLCKMEASCEGASSISSFFIHRLEERLSMRAWVPEGLIGLSLRSSVERETFVARVAARSWAPASPMSFHARWSIVSEGEGLSAWDSAMALAPASPMWLTLM